MSPNHCFIDTTPGRKRPVDPSAVAPKTAVAFFEETPFRRPTLRPVLEKRTKQKTLRLPTSPRLKHPCGKPSLRRGLTCQTTACGQLLTRFAGLLSKSLGFSALKVRLSGKCNMTLYRCYRCLDDGFTCWGSLAVRHSSHDSPMCSDRIVHKVWNGNTSKRGMFFDCQYRHRSDEILSAGKVRPEESSS